MTALGDTLRVERDGWLLVESGWNADRAVAIGSNFSSGNGYLGYRGTAPEQGAADYTALVVTDTYDCADGHWTELATVPDPLFVAATVDGLALTMATAAAVERSLDLADGRVGGRFSQAVGDGNVDVAYERFASYDRLHVVAQRWTPARIDRRRRRASMPVSTPTSGASTADTSRPSRWPPTATHWWPRPPRSRAASTSSSQRGRS
jgi:trehalose/maltose hydrolase-like predicted phosphorylase